MTQRGAGAVLLAALLPGPVAAQAAPPRLAVVIVIDQFRPDYLDRFAPYFGASGFRRFLDAGARFTSGRHAHAVTKTCPGHAVVLTGAYAPVTGIVGNRPDRGFLWTPAQGTQRILTDKYGAYRITGSAEAHFG